MQPGRLQSDGNVSLVWVSEKLHLQVSQTGLPGVELLLRPQPPPKSLNVLHPKLEEVAAIMVAEEESAAREEAASPQEDSAESCTDPGHESPQSIQGDNKLVSESVAQTEDQPFKGSQDDSMDKPCLPQTAPEPQSNPAAQQSLESLLPPEGAQLQTCPAKKLEVPSSQCLAAAQISEPSSLTCLYCSAALQTQ